MDQADVAAVGAQRRAEPGGARPADEDWVRTLAGQGREHDRAVERLHALLLRACRAEVGRRAPRIGLTGRDVDDLAQEAAPDATVAVLAKLSTFRGESLFTTWAYAFAVFEVSAAIGRHLRRTVGVRLDDHAWDSLPDHWGMNPAEHADARELLVELRRAVEEDLTPHQRTVFVAVIVDEISLDALAAELGTNRNALYKTMFDARRKIRDVLIANGYLSANRSGS